MAKNPAKSTSKKARGGGATEAVDPRAYVEPTAAALGATLVELEKVVGKLSPPAEPRPTDLVGGLIHIVIARGLPCGYGQEARDRIAVEFVDSNEFRVTEAFELEGILADLELPDAFERCDELLQAVRQIYNEQNDVVLDFLRGAQVSDRNAFLQRTPAIKPDVAKFLVNLLSFEELVFSDRSTQRVQMRVGFDPKASHVEAFLTRARELLAPFGGLPLDVAPPHAGRKPVLDPVLSPACLLVRHAPAGKR